MLIILGDWPEAEKLTGLLPVEDASVRLLRSELAFVHGDFDGALAEAEMALIDNSAERVKVLVRVLSSASPVSPGDSRCAAIPDPITTAARNALPRNSAVSRRHSKIGAPVTEPS